jgi:hypothetical protein
VIKKLVKNLCVVLQGSGVKILIKDPFIFERNRVMSDKCSDDDFVRLPQGHKVRMGVDWILRSGSLQRATDAMLAQVTIGTGIWYCRRSDYPVEKRVLYEVALSHPAGMSFCWIWPTAMAKHEESGWFATGRKREVPYETGT